VSSDVLDTAAAGLLKGPDERRGLEYLETQIGIYRVQQWALNNASTVTSIFGHLNGPQITNQSVDSASHLAARHVFGFKPQLRSVGSLRAMEATGSLTSLKQGPSPAPGPTSVNIDRSPDCPVMMRWPVHQNHRHGTRLPFPAFMPNEPLQAWDAQGGQTPAD
jgi:hypothetical protein